MNNGEKRLTFTLPEDVEAQVVSLCARSGGERPRAEVLRGLIRRGIAQCCERDAQSCAREGGRRED